VHAVRTQLDRSLDVVVDDEGDAELLEAAAATHDLVGGPALDAQLHDRRARGDGPARRLEVGDDRVHPHRVRARPSSVAGSSAASAS
jgi:hypothetical protein